jgi:hypothetical protein
VVSSNAAEIGQVTGKSDSHRTDIGRKSDRYRSEIGQRADRVETAKNGGFPRFRRTPGPTGRRGRRTAPKDKFL